MKTARKIPITAAKGIATKYGYCQVIIHAYDDISNAQHVTTFGLSLADCQNAADGGNAIKKLLGWTENTDSIPNRVKKLQDENILLKDAIQGLINGHSKKPALPSTAEVVKHCDKYLSDVKGEDTDLFSMFRKQFIEVINFAQGKKAI